MPTAECEQAYHFVVDGVSLAGELLIDAVVFDRVDTEDVGLLERPCRNVVRELPVAGLDTSSFSFHPQ